uniref:RING-type domain-containing protein n=3 Tax=Macrostomum lignano TaxID=282301 RepID=A0A1I8H5J0_9PLAT
SPDAGIVAATQSPPAQSTVVVVAAADAADGSRAAECRADSDQSVPSAMRCLLCRQLMQEPHILICCGATACKRCLHAALFEAGSPSLHRCPACRDKVADVDCLVPNRNLGEAVARFIADNQRNQSTVADSTVPSSPTESKGPTPPPPPASMDEQQTAQCYAWQAANGGYFTAADYAVQYYQQAQLAYAAAYQQLGYYCQPGLAYPLPHQGAPIYSAGPTGGQPLTEAEFRSAQLAHQIPSADGRDGQAAAVDRGGRSRSSRRPVRDCRYYGNSGSRQRRSRSRSRSSSRRHSGRSRNADDGSKRRGRSDKADAGRSRSRSRSRHRGRRCPRSPRSPRSPRDRRRDDSSPIPKRRRVTVSPSPVAYRTFSRMIDQYCSSGTSSAAATAPVEAPDAQQPIADAPAVVISPVRTDGSVKFDKAKLEEMACSAASAAALPDRTESDREEGECESETDGGDSSIGDDIFVVEKCDYNDARVNSVDDGVIDKTVGKSFAL